MNLPYQNCS